MTKNFRITIARLLRRGIAVAPPPRARADPLPYEESAPLPSNIRACIVGLVAAWRLDEDQAASLLQIDLATWRELRDGARPIIFGGETRERIGHCFDVSEAIRTLSPGVDEGDWIRRPYSILYGRTTLHFLMLDEDTLRSIRWTLLTETRPGFPGRPPKA